METPKILESEYRFCRILWEHEPIRSRELAQLCHDRLGWSKTTTYTVIKRLSERGGGAPPDLPSLRSGAGLHCVFG